MHPCGPFLTSGCGFAALGLDLSLHPSARQRTIRKHRPDPSHSVKGKLTAWELSRGEWLGTGKGLERTRNEEWLKDLGILGRRPGAMINAENFEGFLQRMLSKLTRSRVCTVFPAQASHEQTCHWQTVRYRETGFNPV